MIIFFVFDVLYSGFDADITRETDIMFGKKLEIPYWDKIDRRI